METNQIDQSNASEKRKLSPNKTDSITKKMKNNIDDPEKYKDALQIKDLPDDVLIEIIKMVPMAQWASLEMIDHQFQEAVHKVWRSVKEIKLDEQFIYNIKGKEFRNNRLLILHSILEKLILHTPNLTTISGFLEITKHTTNRFSFDDRTLHLLTEFKFLERINFGFIRLSSINVAEFLNTSKSRGRLKELQLKLDDSLDQQQLLRSAFGELPNTNSLELEKIAIRQEDWPSIPLSFVDTINVSKLAGLKFDVTTTNMDNICLLINRCTKLQSLDLNFKIDFEYDNYRQSIYNLLHTIATSPSETLSILKLSAAPVKSYHFEIDREIVKLIDQLGRRQRLMELSLFNGSFCSDEVFMAISKNLIHLKSLELRVTRKKIVDTLELSILIPKLTLLEKLKIYGADSDRVVDVQVISAIAANLSKLKSLYLDYPIKGKSEIFDCLSGLLELKELRIKCGQMSAKTMKAWNGFGGRLESLELPGCSVVCDKAVIAVIEKSPSLRRLNLHNARITDIGLKAIAVFCPLLTKLDIFWCRKTDLGVQALIDRCPLLKLVDMLGDEEVFRSRLKISKYRKIKFALYK